MRGRLEGKVALVTGAGAGLGAATAKRFAEEGAIVIATDINGETVKKVADGIAASGGRAESRVQDVTDEALWSTLIAEIVSAHGGLHVLVNNAGTSILHDIEEHTAEDWRTVNRINGESVFFGTREAIRAMKAGGGSIINIASIMALIGEPSEPSYGYSKAGVRIFSKSMAVHCGEKGYPIRVNTICPGLIQTELLEAGLAQLPEEELEAVKQRVFGRIPVGKFGEPLDIANGCLFLASDESKYVTGAELVIDGGYTAR